MIPDPSGRSPESYHYIMFHHLRFSFSLSLLHCISLLVPLLVQISEQNVGLFGDDHLLGRNVLCGHVNGRPLPGRDVVSGAVEGASGTAQAAVRVQASKVVPVVGGKVLQELA